MLQNVKFSYILQQRVMFFFQIENTKRIQVSWVTED